MKKYLQYLLNDIEVLIEQVPVLTEECLPFGGSEEDEGDIYFSKWIKIAELTNLPAIAFPPAHLLTDLQIIELIEAISDLWSAWQLHWEMPADLSAKKQYAAFVKEMEGDPVLYHPLQGGDVLICNLEEGKPCPFQPGENRCHCRESEECTKHDIELWEEYVYAQGLDPYREITKEEEALFDEEMRQRELKKKNIDYGKKGDIDLTFFYDTEMNADETDDFMHALEINDELLNLIWENLLDPESDLQVEDEDDE